MAAVIGSTINEWTALELVDRLGPIPLHRIRTSPVPGRATEKDVLQIESQENRLFELVDGILVEKCMGTQESALAVQLITILNLFVRANRLGIVLAPDGMLQLAPGLVRIPDVSFIAQAKLVGGRLPPEAIAAIIPDLAVEILSPGNTTQEMERKLRDYFDHGTQLVWYVEPRQRQIEVYRSVTDRTVLLIQDTLSGEPVLPGFSVAVREIFE